MLAVLITILLIWFRVFVQQVSLSLPTCFMLRILFKVYSVVIISRHYVKLAMRSYWTANFPLQYWVSQGNKWCDFCKIFISSNPISIKNHELGQRHKEAVAKKITTMRQDKAAKDKEVKEAARSLEQIEAVRSFNNYFQFLLLSTCKTVVVSLVQKTFPSPKGYCFSGITPSHCRGGGLRIQVSVETVYENRGRDPLNKPRLSIKYLYPLMSYNLQDKL